MFAHREHALPLHDPPVRSLAALRTACSPGWGGLHLRENTTMSRSHGHTGSPTYESWSRMKQRCNNPNDPSYDGYGGSGIMVCDEWNASFEAFLRDMGERPNGCSLDRYPDPSGNYEPGNCRWATPMQQSRNRRDNSLLKHNGKVMTIVEWSEETGIQPSTISKRINKYGWTAEEALSTPVGQNRHVGCSTTQEKPDE